MVKLIYQSTKTLHIRPNGRSADFIAPNFIYGCAGGCRNSYCYVMRYNDKSIYINENIDEILGILNKHIIKLPTKVPNQTDEKFWTYDIGCSTDLSLHWKHTNWLKIFDFFKSHPKAKATFATKYINTSMLEFNPQQKVRIRISLMPSNISNILEPNTSPVIDRIKAINNYVEAGYELHLNFSPIVAYPGWLEDYARLFDQLNKNIDDKYKPVIKAECIFLTHTLKQHDKNLKSGHIQSEALIWKPEVQEMKISQYGGEVVRYKTYIKQNFIQRWSKLHQSIIPWNEIRYIF